MTHRLAARYDLADALELPATRTGALACWSTSSSTPQTIATLRTPGQADAGFPRLMALLLAALFVEVGSSCSSCLAVLWDRKLLIDSFRSSTNC